jgi:para-nitrobenzyl esterase
MAKSKKVVMPISTEGGKIRGKYEESGQVAVFKGVPYAKPPLGEYRWKPPQPVEPWEGTIEATRFGPRALQVDVDFEPFLNDLIDGQGWSSLRSMMIKFLVKVAPKPQQSEDCLYLNIRTPSLDKDAKLPVMVWIHGGGHQWGSGSDIFYDSNALALRGVVVVSINYRLALMGYFTHPELSKESEHGVSGNYGTLDQIAALHWVQSNIEAFGGDPDNVTIFGESAGGESVAHMMTSPLAKGLFHKAIMQSPATNCQMIHLKQPFITYPAAEDIGKTFADKIVSNNGDCLSELRKIPAQKINEILKKKRDLDYFLPVIDGYVIEKSPFEIFLKGEQSRVPLLLGSNSDEGTLFYSLIHTPLMEYRHKGILPHEIPELLRNEFRSEADTLFKLYPGLNDGRDEAIISLLGDNMFGSKAYFYANQAKKVGQTVYVYYFTRTPPSPKQTIGAHHAAEIPFVHGSQSLAFPMTDEEIALSKVMINYWTQFAKTGNPNIAPHPEWPLFDLGDKMWMEIGDSVEKTKIQKEDKYDILIKRLLSQIEEMGKLRNK